MNELSGHIDSEIPHDVSAAIESWQRTISGSRLATACAVWKEAARELRGLAKANATGRPDATGVVRDLIEQALDDMAVAAGVDVAAMDELPEQVAATTWPEPLPITSTLPSVEPFTDAIRDSVLDVADRQQAPPDFVAVTALCGIAAVIGNRVRIRPKRNDDWEVVPTLWGAIIGRPSAMKSPAMRAALAPIYAIQDDLREKWEDEIKSAEIDDALSGLDATAAKKKAGKALKDDDRDLARSILAGLVNADGGTPPCPRIVINDATVEKLGELLKENPRGVLLIRDELPGFLARMESEEHQSERAFYLEAFNGDGRFTYDRIGRGTVHIENAQSASSVVCSRPASHRSSGAPCPAPATTA